MPKVSIVVPVYNVEKYLERCLLAIQNQTLKDIEVILIDDGSTDASGKICDMFAQKDNRFHVEHTRNAGVSNARNMGVRLAKGEYIGFSDADDYMEPDMYETLYQTAVSHGADMTMITIWVHMMSGRVVKRFGTGEIYVWENDEPIKWFLLDQKFCYSCYAHLFRSDFCKSHQFIVGKRVHEDRFYTFEMLQRANKVCVNDVCKYHYILRENSATTGSFSGKQLDILYFADRIQETIEEKYPQYLKEAEMYRLQAYIDVYKAILKGRAFKEYPEEISRIRKGIRGIPKDVIKQYYSPIRCTEIEIMKRFPRLYTGIIMGIRGMKSIIYHVRKNG